MKFTLSWLKEHLVTSATVGDLVEALPRIGLEVEDVTNRGDNLKNIIVVRVEAVEAHPFADGLRVCRVQTGTAIVQVVCGAANVRPGLVTALAFPGATIPRDGKVLKPATIRQVESQGMLCSAEELSLEAFPFMHTPAEGGILSLSEDLAVGTPFAQALDLDDPVITIAITPNRGDCLSVLGIARDLMSAGLGTLQRKAYPAMTSSLPPCDLAVRIAPEAHKDCAFFTGRLISDIENKPSPYWLQKRLIDIGLRPISGFVDIANYVMFDSGQPLHVFDADAITGDLTVSYARAGEAFKALNGQEYPLKEGMLVVRDAAQVLSVAGIMGGEAAACTLKTKRVFVESAYFSPSCIAQTGRLLQLGSDSRYRFERGVDPAQVLKGLHMATRLMLDVSQGTPSALVTAGVEPQTKRAVRLSRRKIFRYSGMDIPVAPLILDKLGFTFEGLSVPPTWSSHQASSQDKEEPTDVTTVLVPSWRHDVTCEEDLVEEVLRIYGYDKIPTKRLPDFAHQRPAASMAALLRRLCAARGLHEALTWSFISPKIAALFGGVNPDLSLVNPISADMAIMRPSLLPQMLIAAQRNADRGINRVALFEVGYQFHSAGMDGQRLVLAGLRGGLFSEPHWSQPEREVDFYDIKGDVFAAAQQAGIPLGGCKLETTKCPSWYHPARVARLVNFRTTLAVFGEIHPGILDALGLRKRCYGFELFLDVWPGLEKKKSKTLPLPELMAVERDFAFLLPERFLVESLLTLVKKADPLIAKVTLFDVYQGPKIEAGWKSIAIRVTIQPQTETLSEGQLTSIQEKIIAQVGEKCRGKLRV